MQQIFIYQKSSVVRLRKISDQDPKKGYIIPKENMVDLPFEIKRVYCIFCNNDKTIRGKHTHKNLKQLIVCLSGSCDIEIEGKNKKKKYTLSNNSEGLIIEDME